MVKDPDKERLETTAHELDMLIKMFQRENGRLPGLADIMTMREAIASVMLDKDDDFGTYAVDTVEVSGGGAFTAHHPPGQKPPERPTYTEAEVREAQRTAYARGRDDERLGREHGDPYE